MLAFEFRDDDVMPVGHQKIDCHMIFDVNMDLTCKARMVAGGHQTVISKESTFSSVISHDSVRIAFTIAALNDQHSCLWCTKCLLECTDKREGVYNCQTWDRDWEWGASCSDCMCTLWFAFKLCTISWTRTLHSCYKILCFPLVLQILTSGCNQLWRLCVCALICGQSTCSISQPTQAAQWKSD